MFDSKVVTVANVLINFTPFFTNCCEAINGHAGVNILYDGGDCEEQGDDSFWRLVSA